MPAPVYPNEKRGVFTAVWLVTLVLAFWLGAWWARPKTSDRAGPPPAIVRTTAVDTIQGRKNGLDPTDPAQVTAGLDRGAAEVGNYRKQAHLARVAARLNLPQVTAALDAEEARGPLDARHEVVEALLARFAEMDPAAATLRGAQLEQKLDGSWSWVDTPLAFWWRRDAHAAQDWAGGLPLGSLRDDVRGELARFLMDSDPEEALRQGLTQNRSLLSGFDVRDLFAALAKNDLARAAGAARAVSRNGRQDDAVEGVLKVWVARDPAAAYTWATTTARTRGERDDDLKNFYELWSEQNASAAGAWALEHELVPGGQGKWNYGFE